MIRELDIVKKYLSTPYKAGGTDIKEGLDCWGLVKNVLSDIKRPVKDVVEFAENCPISERRMIVEKYQEAAIEIQFPSPFDIVLFTLEGYLHAGIVLSKDRFLHTCKAGTGLGRLKDAMWKDKILGYYRVRSND